MADVKIKRDLKVQSGRFKRLLADVKAYAQELDTFTASLAKAETIEDEGDRASKIKLVNNQISETTLALEDCVARSPAAIADLEAALRACPASLRDCTEYVVAVEVYQRGPELGVEVDEELCNQE